MIADDRFERDLHESVREVLSAEIVEQRRIAVNGVFDEIAADRDIASVRDLPNVRDDTVERALASP